MKKIVFLLSFLMMLTACGQQKKYVSYTVKKGETIKSIAKDHDMKTKDLLRLNPDVSRKPSPNTVIIVPNRKTSSKVSINLKEGEKLHKVKRKETLYSISKLYDVSVDDLKKANDLTGNSLSTGREIIIPTKKKVEEVIVEVVEVEAIDTEKFEVHTVEKGDTVYNLTKRFNITEEALNAMNPSLKTDGLKLGMQLIVGEKTEDIAVSLFVDEVTDKPLNILLMLPYKLNKISDFNSQFEKKTSLLNIVTDFHSGVLMAVDSLKRQGMNVNLKVMDTENSVSKVLSSVEGVGKDDYDAVIGPLFLKNAELAAKKLDIPVIAPMYSKNQAKISNKSLVKVSPDKNLLEEKLIDYMLDNYNGEKLIISGDDSQKSAVKIAKFSSQLKSHDSINEISIIKPENGYIDREKFNKVVDTLGRKNWVLLVGNDNITANDVVNNLGVIPTEKAEIQLFSLEKGKNFTNISNNQLERLNFTYPKAQFIDDLAESTKAFNKKYRAKYYRYPSEYAIKGFDVTYDTLLRLANYDSFNEGADAGVSKRIGSKFDYSKKLFSGQENNGVYLIQYQEGLKLVDLE